jgi:excisionase family DNA binding protein
MSIHSTGAGKPGLLNTQIIEGRLTLTIAQACEATGLSRITLWRLRRDRKLRTVAVGTRKLIVVDSLLRLLESEGDSIAA